VSQADRGNPRRILAAGLSPAWQQIMVFDEFTSGEVNRACEVHWCGSGKVLNVGIALARLAASDTHCSAQVLSVIGPRARAAIDSEFTELGVNCRWVETRTETRICTTIVDRSSGRTTELVENAPPLTAHELAQFRDAFAEEAARADVVLWTGSLPAGVDSRHVAESLRDSEARLGETRPRAILDIRGPELLLALECKPFCIKPNRDELAGTIGRKLATDDDLLAAMRELNARGAEWVVVTHGADAVWASHGGRLHKLQPPRIENIVNPIGSGDCLAAGIALATASGKDMIDAIRFGIAAACDNVGQLLPARIDASRVLTLQNQIT
jgi:1-phosphofructokinase family hexose kinase